MNTIKCSAEQKGINFPRDIPMPLAAAVSEHFMSVPIFFCIIDKLNEKG